MQIFDSLTDQSSGDPTIAVATLAHAGYLGDFALGSWQLAKKDPRIAFGDPTVFSVSRRNPDASLLGSVSNQEGPFGVESLDVLIGDFSGSDGIYYNKIFSAQNQLWANPNQPGNGSHGDGNSNIENQVFTIGRVTNGLDQKQNVKQNGNRTPNDVSFWSVRNNSFHASIFAGESLDRKNQTK